ncbi:MAG: molybdenum cofactor synthesis domain-containing protein [Nocardioidaceae bacterium]
MSLKRMPPAGSGIAAAVLTVSDGVVHGTRTDEAGPAVADLLERAGFEVVRRQVVPDETDAIASSLRDLAETARLVVSTGGTGFGPRDLTPEATKAVIEREAPGLAEAMRAAGREQTPMASLSRGVAGSFGSTLVLNLPGSRLGAVESLEAVLDVLPHAVRLLGGDTRHEPEAGGQQQRHPPIEPHGTQPAATDVAAELAERLRRGEQVVLATAVSARGAPPGGPGRKLLLADGRLVAGTLGCAEFDELAAADAAPVLASGAPVLRTYEHETGSVDVYLEPYLRPRRLVVLGATPVALWVLRWARPLGYDPVLIEPRPERVTPEHRAAARVVAASPGELAGDTPSDVVHTDHDAPMVAEHLAELITGGAGFVGLMGSARHAGPPIEAIAALGVPESAVARIQTPVGLDLGARTPAEIALSILSGLLAQARGRSGGWLDARGQASVATGESGREHQSLQDPA